MHFPLQTLRALIISILLSTFLSSCGNLKEKGYDTKAIADEVRNREIKHVTQAQLDAAVNGWGEKIVQTANQNLIEVLKTALSTYPLEEAAAYCSTARLTKANSLSQVYKATLNRSSLRDLATTSQLAAKEREILDAYLYNAENKLPQRSNIQRLSDQALLFTSPVVLNNALCLRCHGEAGTDITLADYQKLRERYNLDSLSGRKTNDLLGMWRVSFQKKEVIKNLDMK